MLVLNRITNSCIAQAQNSSPFWIDFTRIATVHRIGITMRPCIHRGMCGTIGFLLTCNTGNQIILTASKVPFMLYIYTILTSYITGFGRLELFSTMNTAFTTHSTVIIKQCSRRIIIFINQRCIITVILVMICRRMTSLSHRISFCTNQTKGGTAFSASII